MRYKYVLAYGLPILAFLILDQFMGREYYSFPNDATSSHFGLGLNLLYGDFNVTFHHPAFTFIFLQSLLAPAVIGHETLDAFYWLGFCVNIVFVVIASFLVAHFSSILRVPIYIPMVLSLMAISMPTVALLGPLVGAYFPVGILSPALGLGLHVLIASETPQRRGATIVLVLIGFFMANLFLVMPVVVGVIVGFVWLTYKQGLDKLLSRLSSEPKTQSWLLVIVTLLVLVFVCRNALDLLRFQSGLMIGNGKTWLLTSVLSLGSLYLIFKVPVVWRLWWALFAPIAIGWFLASNFFVRYWSSAFFGAMGRKGGADPGLPFSEVMEKADFGGYLAAWSWHWMLIVGVVLTIVMIADSLRRRENYTIAVFALIFVSVSLSLTFVMVASVSFINPSSDPMSYGLSSRYIMLSIVVIAFILTMLGESENKALKVGGFSAVFIVVGFAFNDYIFVAKTVMPFFNEREQRLQQAVDAHLTQSPENDVVCLRTEQPRPCATLYGFNNYRLTKGLSAVHKETLRNGRIGYAFNFAKACPNLDRCRLSTLYIGIPPINPADNKKIEVVVRDSFTTSISAFRMVPK